jgi:alkanesulfonate monooxygenase SsuD/methylene tetrahydromethanopterin reductase-like flavin-dependent oxidoreductase (luciferase family)
MGEVIAQIRSLLGGGKVDGVRLEVATPVPLVVAALGPRMLRLAGATADGVLLNWVTPDFVARARADVDLGARSAGRDPRAIRLAGYVRVAAAPMPTVAEAVKRELAQFATVPAYERHFGALGIDAAALKDQQLADLVIAATNREAIHSGFDRFRRAGLDEVVVRPVDGGHSWWDVAELAAPQPS